MSFRQNRMAHASEILTDIANSGLRYIEVPVTVDYTPYSLAKGQPRFLELTQYFIACGLDLVHVARRRAHVRYWRFADIACALHMFAFDPSGHRT